MARYDLIGIDYANLRRPDPQIAGAIMAALGSAKTVLNVGAGSGSYEPDDREVIALELSETMIAQRPDESAPVVRGRAEALPFADQSVDAGLAILTVHHWSDKARGLAELSRVSRDRVVILTFDGRFPGIWLTDYMPELAALDARQMPDLEDYGAWLGPGRVEIHPVPIPHNCVDGFLYAYWRRPAAYLDERIRAAMSSFWAIGDVTEALARLDADLKSGAWEARYGALLDQDSLECGYRLVVWDRQ
ncbi:MAG: class I SAM-dependent methyltransferase [Rhodospirillaceae bacterium]